jgi:hypothetical protein
MAHQHPRVADWPLAPGKDDHGRTVTRRHVPAGEPQAVAGGQRHVDVGRPRSTLCTAARALRLATIANATAITTKTAASAATAPMNPRRK